MSAFLDYLLGRGPLPPMGNEPQPPLLAAEPKAPIPGTGMRTADGQVLYRDADGPVVPAMSNLPPEYQSFPEVPPDLMRRAQMGEDVRAINLKPVNIDIKPPIDTTVDVREPGQGPMLASSDANFVPEHRPSHAPPVGPAVDYLARLGLHPQDAQAALAQLQQAQEQERKANMFNGIFEGTNTIADAIGTRGGMSRAKVPDLSGYFQQKRQEAHRPVAELQARQALEDQQMGRAKEAFGLNEAMADADPNSQGNQSFLAALKQLPAFRNIDFSGLSAKQLPGFAKFAEQDQGIQQKREAAKDKLNDPLRLMAITNAADRIQNTQERTDFLRRNLGLRESKFSNEMHDRTEGGPGVDLGPNGIEKKEAGKVRDYQFALTRLNEAIDGVRKDFKKSGPQLLPTDAAARMEAFRARAIPLINQLEQMSPGMPKGHQHILEEQLRNPDSIKNFFNSGQFDQQMNLVQDAANRGLQHLVQAKGGHLKEGSPQAQKADAADPHKHATMKLNGETWTRGEDGLYYKDK